MKGCTDMTKMNKYVVASLGVVILFTISGCGPQSKTVESFEMTEEFTGLKLDESHSPTLIYRRPGAPTLAAYNRFIIDPVQICYNDPKMEDLAPEKIGKMQEYFRDALIKELREAGYEVGTKSQPGTLRISFTISGLQAPGTAANVAMMGAGAVVPPLGMYSISVGSVTVKGVFRESLSNRIDGIAIERTEGSRWLNSKPWSSWADVQATFDNWAKGIRESIDETHKK